VLYCRFFDAPVGIVRSITAIEPGRTRQDPVGLAKRPMALNEPSRSLTLTTSTPLRVRPIGLAISCSLTSVALRSRARGQLVRSLGRPAGSPPAAAPEHFKRPRKFRNADLADRMRPPRLQGDDGGRTDEEPPDQPTDQAQYAEKRAGIAGADASTSETLIDSATCI
jgi:hypothetical protein